MNRKILVAVLSAAFLLSACAGKKPQTDAGAGETVGSTADSDANSSGVATVSAGEGTGSQGALGPTGALGSQRVIYFDFDSSDIRNDFVDVIAAHGRFLAGNASVRVRLEGHGDERGSREYNLGLGERRGNAVSTALQGNGGSASQLSVVSYGEERPTCTDASESCWSQNRRVEIVYTAK